MTRSTHLPHPSPDDVRTLLAEAGLTPYAAAQTLPIGITRQALELALGGKRQLSGTVWFLLRLCLSKSARRELPAPVID